jgi:hypothetical protein
MIPRRFVTAIALFVISTSLFARGQKIIPVPFSSFQYCINQASLYCFYPTFGLQSTLPFGGVTLQGNFGQGSVGFSEVSTLLGAETALLPLPSPASGITFKYDPRLGIFVKTQESLGPILTERAETTGKGKLTLTFAYEHVGYDSIDGAALKNLQINLSTSTGKLSVDEYTTFLTYGFTQWLDFSAAFPVRSVRMEATGFNATFIPATGNFAFTPGFSQQAGSTGLGDIVLRTKGRVLRREQGGVSLGFELRTPTGDYHNFVGSGAFGGKPFVAASWAFRPKHLYLAPHVNLGYEFNGTSLLGGSLEGQEGRLPRRLEWAVGSEIGAQRKRRSLSTLSANTCTAQKS